MKVWWPGLALVAVLVAGILLVKNRARENIELATVSRAPSVVLVADFREANEKGDRCSEIIQAVREANKRGVRVTELSPDSKSDLLQRYRVVIVPTVLLLDSTGHEVSRFEGEDTATVHTIKSRLTALARTTR